MYLGGGEDAKKHLTLGFQTGFTLLSQISFFLCKPSIAWRGKNPTVLSQKGRVLICLPLNVIVLLLPYLYQYLLNRFDQPEAIGTCSFCCVCNSNNKKKGIQISSSALLKIFGDAP